MARKTTGNEGSGRGKKAASSAIAAAQVVPEVRKNLIPINLEDEIRRRAYELYLERGSVPGNQEEDWIAAEREVLSRYQQREQSA